MSPELFTYTKLTHGKNHVNLLGILSFCLAIAKLCKKISYLSTWLICDIRSLFKRKTSFRSARGFLSFHILCICYDLLVIGHEHLH